MEHVRAAERALVAALVMGEVHPADLAGRVDRLDFTDQAAATCFAVALEQGRCGALVDLPELLRARGALRSDGYPIRELLGWPPSLPVPVHPQAWATLVVAGSLGRVVQACGTRLMQAADVQDTGVRREAGRALAIAAAQRATVHSALRRWESLPAEWRDTVPRSDPRDTVGFADLVNLVDEDRRTAVAGGGPAPQPAPVPAVEREVLAGLISGPRLLEEVPWLRAEDFTAPAAGQLYTAARGLHHAGRSLDAVTLAVMLDAVLDGRVDASTDVISPAATGAPKDAPDATPHAARNAASFLLRELRPELALPGSVTFLARRLVQDSTVRRVHQTGRDLVQLAQAPRAAGGLGRPLLTAALERLDALRPYAERLRAGEPSHRRQAFARAQDHGLAMGRPVGRAVAAADRQVG